jgi:ubiquitin C-terminal hydrolase
MDHPRGLFNLGSTCYLNTLVQCLVSSDRFTRYIENVQTHQDAHIARVIQNLIRLMKNSKDMQGALMPADVIRAFQMVFSFMNITTQNDMHEMYTYTIDRLNQELKTDLPPTTPVELDAAAPPTLYDKLRAKCTRAWRQQIQHEYSPLREMMYGMTISQIRCNNCQYIHHNLQTFNVWEIAMVDSTAEMSLQDLFQASCQSEMLTEWTCSECKQTIPSERMTQIWSLPPLLVFTLQRFKRNGNGSISKHRGHVSIPESIALQGLEDYKNDEKKQYELKSIGMHQGDVNGGHYYSISKRMNAWHVINDANVSSKHINVPSSDVYMLFYEQI